MVDRIAALGLFTGSCGGLISALFFWLPGGEATALAFIVLPLAALIIAGESQRGPRAGRHRAGPGGLRLRPGGH